MKEKIIHVLKILSKPWGQMVDFANNNYNIYQRLADSLKLLLEHDETPLTPLLKARAYLDSVYADYIFKDERALADFTTKLEDSLAFLENNEAFINERLLAYISIFHSFICFRA